MKHSDADVGDRFRQGWQQLDRQAFQLYEQGRHDEAIRMATQACELARQQFGADHPDYATSLGNMAVLRMRMSNYTTAEPLMRQALEIKRKALGEDHPDYVNSLNNLAGLYYYMGNHAESAQLYHQVVNIKRTIMRENDPDYIASLNNLTEIYRSMGNYAAAEPLCLQALEIRRKALGEDDPDYATSLNNLAVLYRAMGKNAAAEPLLCQALRISRKTLGEDHPDYATNLDNLAVLYVVMGKFAEAEPLFHQALEIKRKALGEDHPDYAISLNNLAEFYRAMGNDAAAAPLYNQAIEIWALGEDRLSYATGLNNLGRLYHDQRNYAAAEALLREALKIRGEVVGESHPDYIQSLNHLAKLYLDLRNYSAAEPLLREALKIGRKTQGEDHPDYATSLENLAVLYHNMGRSAEAKPLVRQALEIKRKALGEDHPGYTTSLNYLGNLYHDAGDYSAAEALYRQALEIARKAPGGNHPELAKSLKNLADLYRGMGNYALAEPLYWEARDVLRQALGEEHPDYAMSLIDLAGMHLDRYRHFYDGPPFIYFEAQLAYQTALEILGRTQGEEHPNYALALDGMATYHTRLAQYTTAEPLYRQALEIWRTALGEDHPGYTTQLNNLGVLYLSWGKYEAAEPLLRQALAMRRRTLGEEHPLCAISLTNLAIVAVAAGHQSDALRLMKTAVKIHDRLIGQVFSISSESHRMNYIKDLQEELNTFLSLAANYSSVAPEVVPAALELVLRRKALGAEALATQRNAVLSGRYPALEPVFRELSTLRARIAQKILAGPDRPEEEALRAHQQQLAEWGAQKARLEADCARQIPEMTLEQQFHTADLQAIASCLPAGAALVEFIRFRECDFLSGPGQTVTMNWDHTLERWDEGHRARYLAFVLRAGEPDNVQMLDLGAAHSIDQAIVAFREAATGRGRSLTKEPDETKQAGDATRTAGVALRAAVLDPLQYALGGRTRLFLSPDGDLTQLPFEALPLDDGRWVIDDYQISYLSTGRDLLRFRTIASQPPTLPGILADPDFDLDAEGTDSRAGEQQPCSPQSRDLDRSTLRFTRLIGAHQEGQQVGDLLGVPPLLAEAALEGPLKRLRSPSILHLATHGFFLPDQPIDPFRPLAGLMGERLFGQRLENPLLRSGLALAGANSWLKGKTLRPEAEDGLLTAEDVTGLDLLDTELVVLSACDTGRGEVHVGEGVFGLRRAFVLAGAKTLVTSLWKVPDQATRELMVDFYQRILAGTPRAEALRAAQRTLKARPAYAHPRFWGAFICQGDPSPLS